MIKVTKELLDGLVCLEILDCQVKEDHQEHLDCQESKEKKECQYL